MSSDKVANDGVKNAIAHLELEERLGNLDATLSRITEITSELTQGEAGDGRGGKAPREKIPQSQ